MRRTLTFALLLAFPAASIGDAAPAWQTLAPGMELGTFALRTEPRPSESSGSSGDSAASGAEIMVLRIDPKLWELEFEGISRTGEAQGHTAREWCEKQKLSAAINAGMFDADYKTHLGYLGAGEHVNNGRVNNYQSVAAFAPRDPKLAGFHIFDLDQPGVSVRSILRDYAAAVQNLRLIKRPGTNQWEKQTRRWSEAALGEDEAGRILFIFSRTPFSMHDFNRELLAAGIGVVAAQHLEGGPEAQLYVHVGKTERELFGSYETSFRENDSNAVAWPVPNVLGVRPRK
ncbi:MAG TPA: phosphodiester glycosidase family protein [Candidatus Angelobacter sp.]|nr:phosphodiester glycosidase family protein [Candidatus Angelobacter sp.]